MAFLLAATSLLLSLPIWLTSGRRRFDAAEPVWLLTVMYALSFWGRPLLVLYDPVNYMVDFVSYEAESMVTASSLALVGLVGFYLGYYSRIPQSMASTLPKLPWPWRPVRVVAALLVVAVAFGYLGHHFFAKGQFSLEYIYANRPLLNWGDGDLAQLTHLTGWWVVMLSFALYLLSARRPGIGLAACVGVTTVTLAVLSIFGARWSLFFVVGALTIVWHYARGPFKVKTWIGVFALFFVASAQFGVWRAGMDLRAIAPERLLDNLVTETRQYLEWDVLSEIVRTYPGSDGHSYGWLGFETALWLVPRRVWPGKPEWYGTTTIQRAIFPGVVDLTDEGFVGSFLTISTAGEGYVEFGWAGTLIYLFLFGVLWRLIYEFKERNQNSVPAVALYAVLVVSIPVYVRGFATVLLMIAVWFTLHVTLFRWLSGPCARQLERRTIASSGRRALT
jgi:hypothetical protein